MKGFVLIRHKVRNFTAWKEGFDAHAPRRADAGLSDQHVLRSIRAPNDVVVLLEAQDLGRAQAFAESADLRDTMQKFGVIGEPDVCFLNQ
jgi:hypothetical protein